MSFISILKTVLSIGTKTVPSILAVVAPGIGGIVSTVLNAILQAEAKVGAGNGAAKAQIVTDTLNVAAPLMVQILEAQTGKEIADEALFAAGLAEMQEGLVKVLNAFRILPK
jgi:hypothetical protein